MKFQKRHARVQFEAAKLAEKFNSRLASGVAEWFVSFLAVSVYMVEDPSYSDGVAWLLAENELDGAVTKWNNNVIFTTNSKMPNFPFGRTLC